MQANEERKVAAWAIIRSTPGRGSGGHGAESIQILGGPAEDVISRHVLCSDTYNLGWLLAPCVSCWLFHIADSYDAEVDAQHLFADKQGLWQAPHWLIARALVAGKAQDSY